VTVYRVRLPERERLEGVGRQFGGELVCKDLGKRVEIGGRAVTYLVGEISL